MYARERVWCVERFIGRKVKTGGGLRIPSGSVILKSDLMARQEVVPKSTSRLAAASPLEACKFNEVMCVHIKACAFACIDSSVGFCLTQLLDLL